MVRGPLGGRSGRAVLAGFYAYLLLHAATGAVLFLTKLGWTPASVARYYRGDPERFLNPRSFQGLLEVTHFHLFAFGFFYVVVAHLLLHAGLPRAVRTALLSGLGLALTADLAAGWLVRYLHPGFAWLKLGGFWAMEAFTVVSLLVLTGALFRKG